MKIIINKIITFKGFKCINLFGILFCRKQLNKIDINHEVIHTKQMQEMLYIPFYVWYVIEYLIKLFTGGTYRDLSFEREAYNNQYNLNYLNNRKHYSWIKYVVKRK